MPQDHLALLLHLHLVQPWDLNQLNVLCPQDPQDPQGQPHLQHLVLLWDLTQRIIPMKNHTHIPLIIQEMNPHIALTLITTIKNTLQ